MTLTKLEDQLVKWQEHFQYMLQRPPATNPPNLKPGPTLNIDVEDIQKRKLYQQNRKAGRNDNKPPDALKYIQYLSFLFSQSSKQDIWNVYPQKKPDSKDTKKGGHLSVEERNWFAITVIHAATY